MPYVDPELVGVLIFEKDENGKVLFATCSGEPAATADEYAKGAIVIDRVSGIMYQNSGTVAAPAWTELRSGGDVELVVSKETNGTTAVSVFGSAGLPVGITITDVSLTALDTTAGNITVEAPAATVVCTIAKGTAAGALVGATTLANTVVPAGTNVVVDSSSAGNARVRIAYRITV